MKCPNLACSKKASVLEARPAKVANVVSRRYECACGLRFSTIERLKVGAYTGIKKEYKAKQNPLQWGIPVKV